MKFFLITQFLILNSYLFSENLSYKKTLVDDYFKALQKFELSEKHPKVIHHYTVPARPQDEGLINDPNISNTIGNFDILK